MDNQLAEELHRDIISRAWNSYHCTFNDKPIPAVMLDVSDLTKEDRARSLYILQEGYQLEAEQEKIYVGGKLSPDFRYIFLRGDGVEKLQAAKAFANPENWEDGFNKATVTLPKMTKNQVEYLQEVAQSWRVDLTRAELDIQLAAKSITNGVSAKDILKKGGFKAGFGKIRKNAADALLKEAEKVTERVAGNTVLVVDGALNKTQLRRVIPWVLEQPGIPQARADAAPLKRLDH